MKKIKLYGILILLTFYFTGTSGYTDTGEHTTPVLKDTAGRSRTDIHKGSDSLSFPKENRYFYFLMYS